MRRRHDPEYKKIFSNVEMFRELLELVDEPWVKEIDFSKAEKVNKSYVSQGIVEKESDLIWKVSLGGREAYVYVLLEFQSTVDQFMALRLLRYICEFYENLREEQKLKVLPAVFPLVLYNGDQKWSAPSRFEELVEKIAGLNYAPEFRYFKVIENEMERERLWELRNGLAALFLVETETPLNLVKQMEKFKGLLSEESMETVTLLVNFLGRKMYQGKKGKAMKRITDKTHAMMEVENMIETQWKKAEKQIYEQGRQEGRKETARRLKAFGTPLEVIVKSTGLSEEEINEL
jgi:predicted transposase/invertase (TIGR01784 family)